MTGIFKTMRLDMPPPPADPQRSPFAWGRGERVQELLGTTFDLTVEPGTTVLHTPSAQVVWDVFVNGYGPTKTLAASLDPGKHSSLERDFIAMHEKCLTPAGIAMPCEYLVTMGVRK